jgi:hypothetical protein
LGQSRLIPYGHRDFSRVEMICKASQTDARNCGKTRYSWNQSGSVR